MVRLFCSADFFMSKYVHSKCIYKSGFVQLCDFRRVRWFLTYDALVSWIIVIHFSGVSSSLIYINYNVSKIMQLELDQTQIDTLT